MNAHAAHARPTYAERSRGLAAEYLHLRVCEPGERERPYWRQADDELRRIARAYVGLDAEQARWLRVALETRVWEPLGMGSIVEYLERTFGYKPRESYERLRVAKALEPLVLVTAGLRRGELCWAAVRELTRVVVPETEVEWVEAARGKTVRQIEAMVNGRRPGDRPSDPASADAKRHVLTFEVSGATLALFREALAAVRRDAGTRLDDDDALALVARRVLGGPGDAGRAGRQIVVMKCPACDRTTQTGGGAQVALDQVERAAAECDAQVVELDRGEDANAEARPVTHVGPASVGSAEGHAPRVGPAPSSLRKRATQTIPPATRRHVLLRQHDRCAVPGCAHTAYLDVHHLDLRSEGGTHDPDRLLALCDAHHRAVHRGELIIGGRFSAGHTFSHADGSEYGGHVDVGRAAALGEAFEALRALGYREGEARQALDQLRTHVGIDEPASAVVMRALELLRGVSAGGSGLGAPAGVSGGAPAG